MAKNESAADCEQSYIKDMISVECDKCYEIPSYIKTTDLKFIEMVFICKHPDYTKFDTYDIIESLDDRTMTINIEIGENKNLAIKSSIHHEGYLSYIKYLKRRY